MQSFANQCLIGDMGRIGADFLQGYRLARPVERIVPTAEGARRITERPAPEVRV